MKRKIFALLLLLTAGVCRADLNVFATVPEWGALVGEIGGDKVRVYTATTAFQDPHRIDARPSLLAQARRAQMIVAVGADLEVGWLPVVLRDSANVAVQPGQSGYFEAAAQVHRLEVPTVIDRAHGDVHAAGNPHVHLDPRNVLRVGEALARRMAELDTANAVVYQANFQNFRGKWQAAMERWQKEAAPLRGINVVVHHKSFVYLENWLGLVQAGTLEPKPGVEPSSGQLAALLEAQRSKPAKMILRTAYQPDGPSKWLAEKAGIPAVMLPYTVGGSERAANLFGLFDDSVQRLLQGLR